MEGPETEILVHVAAPARAADDTKYRALAAAYLEFEPTTRISVAHGASEVDGQGVSQDMEGTGKMSSQVEDGFQSTPNFGEIHSPMLSFKSVTNNLRSPRLRQPDERNMPETQPSWQPPPSVVEDSMPDNDFALAQYCTPTRLLEHYTSALGSTQLNSSPTPGRIQSQTPPVSGQPPRRSPSPEFSRNSGGQYQSSYEVSRTVIPLTPAGNYKRPWPTPPTSSAIVEETRIASSQPGEATSSFRSESEPPLLKRPRTSKDPEPSKPLIRSASDMGPQTQRAKPNVPYQPIPGHLEILSPAPLTSQRELVPEDMITDVLARLARELDLSKRYKPEFQARDLRPFERGYWLVDCSSWEPELKRSAWGFLTDYLGKGVTGWGTSCKRDRDFTWIRLYCWGCVTGHMYLVLYLMSKRRVLYTGTRWVGADGRDVVVMGARPAPVRAR